MASHEPQDPDRRYPRALFDPQAFAGFLRGRTVQHAKPMRGGACNTNHRLTLSDGQTFLARQYARGSPEADSNAMRLARNAVPLPDLLWHEGSSAVFTFVQGQHLNHDAEAIRSAGRTLAALTSIRFDRSGQIQTDGTAKPFDWGTPGDRLLKELADQQVESWLGRRRLDAMLQLHERFDVFAIDVNTGPCLVHGDFRPDNLLIRNGQIVAVLDWEFSHAGSWLMDLGNLLRHFDEDAEAHALQGLREGGLDVPKDTIDRAKLADLSSHLEFLTSARSDAFKATRVARIDQTLERFNANTN